MFFTLHPSSGVPLYQQLLGQLRERIASGQAQAGTQLPSSRELAGQLGINLLTVTKVFQILEQEGLVEFRRGQGTFVRERQGSQTDKLRNALLAEAVEQVVARARNLGVAQEELAALIRESFARPAGKRRAP